MVDFKMRYNHKTWNLSYILYKNTNSQQYHSAYLRDYSWSDTAKYIHLCLRTSICIVSYSVRMTSNFLLAHITDGFKIDLIHKAWVNLWQGFQTLSNGLSSLLTTTDCVPPPHLPQNFKVRSAYLQYKIQVGYVGLKTTQNVPELKVYNRD